MLGTSQGINTFQPGGPSGRSAIRQQIYAGTKKIVRCMGESPAEKDGEDRPIRRQVRRENYTSSEDKPSRRTGNSSSDEG